MPLQSQPNKEVALDHLRDVIHNLKDVGGVVVAVIAKSKASQAKNNTILSI